MTSIASWDKAARTGAAPFSQAPYQKKSQVIKENEQAIKEYRNSFLANTQPRQRSRGMSTYTKPARLKSMVSVTAMDYLSEFQPPSFQKTQEEIKIIKSVMAENIFFNDLSRQEQEIFVNAFEPIQVKEKSIIIKQGEKGDYFYILQHGKISFYVEKSKVSTIMDGSCFGDLALLYSAPRAATARAKTPCKLFRVDQKTFKMLLTKQSKILKNEKLNVLKSIDFLKDVPLEDLKKLSASMRPLTFKEGEVLVKKGAPGTTFYLVAEGELVVTDISVGSIEFDNALLKRNDYFGERALATNEPRTANITATTAGTVFYIRKKTFDKILGEYSRLMTKAQDRRVLQGIDYLHIVSLTHSQFEALADLVVDKEFKEGERIFSPESETEAAVYIVRTGTVSIVGAGKDDIILSGGYFGEQSLLLDTRHTSKRLNKLVPRYTAIASEDSFLGVLTLSECRQIFDTTIIPDLHGENKFYPEEDSDVSDEEIEFTVAPSNLGRETTVHWLKKTSCDTLRSAVQTKSLEDFEEHSVLGKGTYGEVSLVSAVLPGFGREFFAMKKQHRNKLENQIQREIDVLKQMDHPFIITYVNHYVDPEKSYILMRLIHGGELFDVIHYENDDGTWSSGIPEIDAKFYAMVICDSLEYLHRKKFVFRDLKPENILIDKDGYPVICDFGFAKYVEDVTFTMCGTPNYISPEIILNKGHAAPTDHWSLGILIYEMVAGENPFFYDGMNQMELLENIVEEKYYPLPNEVSDECFHVVDGLLEKDSTLRLGNLKGRGKDIINKDWFKEFDLSQLRQKRYKPSFIPKNKELELIMGTVPPATAPSTSFGNGLEPLSNPAKYGSVKKAAFGDLLAD